MVEPVEMEACAIESQALYLRSNLNNNQEYVLEKKSTSIVVPNTLFTRLITFNL